MRQIIFSGKGNRMNAKKFLIEFLKGLEASIPPPENCHHGITFAQYGSDKTGWMDMVAVQVNKHGKFHCFFLEESDFESDPSIAVAKIKSTFSNPDPHSQLGVSFGRYIAGVKE